MKLSLTLLLPLVAIALISAPLIPIFKGPINGVRAKRRIIANLCAFGGVILTAIILPISGFVSASEVVAQVDPLAMGMGFISAALVTGLSCLGTGIAVAAAAPAAIGAVSEDPKSFGKSMIFVVLGEGVAIYGLLVSILILNRL